MRFVNGIAPTVSTMIRLWICIISKWVHYLAATNLLTNRLNHAICLFITIHRFPFFYSNFSYLLADFQKNMHCFSALDTLNILYHFLCKEKQGVWQASKIKFCFLWNSILLPKLFWPTVRKKDKLLKFEAEGHEFAKFLRSLEQFIQTVKGQNNFW